MINDSSGSILFLLSEVFRIYKYLFENKYFDSKDLGRLFINFVIRGVERRRILYWRRLTHHFKNKLCHFLLPDHGLLS